MEMSLIQMFHDRGCLQISPNDYFTYASGLKGPIYCDNRLILGDSKLREETLGSLISLIGSWKIEFEAVMAMATGAIALGSLLSDRLELPLGYIRTEPKAHGSGSRIEGGVDKTKKVLVFEDLVNQGSSVKSGVLALRESGYDIAGVVSIVNYEFDMAENYFKAESIPFRSIIKFSDLLEFYASGLDQKETRAALIRWHNKLNQ